MNIKNSASGLKDAWKHAFSVGTAVSQSILEKPVAVDIIRTHFSCLTAENSMKAINLQPQEGKWNWKEADFIADFSRKEGLTMRGHTLLWDRQTPSWFFHPRNNKSIISSIHCRLENHISEVMNRYKDIVHSWDVLNCVLDIEKGTPEGFKQTNWLDAGGISLYEKAFFIAHQQAPQAKLYYNDFNIESGKKKTKNIEFLSNLLDKGVPVHGVGIQGHWDCDRPKDDELREAIEQYTALGLEIELTELDVSIYGVNELDLHLTQLSKDRAFKQIQKYQSIFRIASDYPSVKGITTWGLADNHTWLDYIPIHGRKDWPLLFNENYQEKDIVPILMDTGFNLQD